MFVPSSFPPPPPFPPPSITTIHDNHPPRPHTLRALLPARLVAVLRAARRRERDGLRPTPLAVRETQPKIQARPEEARGPVTWTTESDEPQRRDMAAARAGGKEGVVASAVECACACSSICLCACARFRRDASVRHLDRKRASRWCAPAAVGVRDAQTSRGDPPGAVQLLWQAPGQRHPPSHDRCLQSVAARLRSLPPAPSQLALSPCPCLSRMSLPQNREGRSVYSKTTRRRRVALLCSGAQTLALDLWQRLAPSLLHAHELALCLCLMPTLSLCASASYHSHC